MATTIVVDTDGVHGDYASLDAAIDALNSSGLSDDTIVQCQATGDTADTTAVSTIAVALNGYTLTIRAAAGDRASLSWSTSRYRLSLAGTPILAVDTACRIEGLQIEGTATSGTQDGIKITGVAVTIDSCLIKGAGTYGRIGIWCSTGSTVTGINTALYNWHNSNYGVVYADTATSKWYGNNCLVYSAASRPAYQGDNASAVVETYNCVGYNTSDGYDVWLTNGGSLTGDYNCSVTSAGDDATAPGVNSLNSKALANVDWTNTTGGSEDFHILTTSELKGAGVDRSAQGYSDDIDGTARGATWDIGPHEFAAESGASIAAAVHARRRR